jgi:hypothetical protein
MGKWIPLSSVRRMDAIGKLARTHDRRRGTVVEFVGRSAILNVGGKRVTVPADECKALILQTGGK